MTTMDMERFTNQRQAGFFRIPKPDGYIAGAPSHPPHNALMLKSISNSKLFFVALGITIGLCGVRVIAGPTQSSYNLGNIERSLDKIATSLDRIQRDGVRIEQSSSNRFRVEVVK